MKNTRPPIAERPLASDGFFSIPWSRFFLNLETDSEADQSGSVAQILQSVASSSTTQDIQTDLDNTKKEQLLNSNIFLNAITELKQLIQDINRRNAITEVANLDKIQELKAQVTDLKRQLLFLVSENQDLSQTLRDIRVYLIALEKE